jgi:predicted nuclease with TOPRIM domain
MECILSKMKKMNNHKEMLDILIRSLDQESGQEEKARLQEALEHSEDLRREKARLEQMRAWLAGLQAPIDERFADRVADRIEEEKNSSFNTVILNLFPKAVAACLLVFMLTLMGIYLSEGALSADAIIGVDDVTLEDTYSLTEF